MLTDLGHPTSAEEAVDLYSGHRWTDCHRMIEEAADRTFDADALGRAVDEAVAGRVGDILAIEGIEAFLEAQAHRPLGIASSSEKGWLDEMVARLGLDRFFKGKVFSGATIARGKPHPDIYLHAATKLGVAPARCLVIEDHQVGVAAGAAAGMTVIALLAARHIRDGHEEKVRAAGAHHVARSYSEVAQILERLER